MRKITKLVAAVMALTILLLLLVSCTRKPGLYSWYGRVKVDYILKMTVDAGDGEKTYDVPFDTYRNLWVYFATLVSDVIKQSEDSQQLTTKEQKTAVLKEYTEDELCEYYALVAIAERYGVSITDADKENFKNDYYSRIEKYIDTLDEKYKDDFKGTKEEYAKYLYEKAITNLGMTEEYIEYLYYKNLLTRRVKMALVPGLRSYAEQRYFHFKQVYIEYTKGDDAQESKANEDIRKAYAELKSGVSMDEVIDKYSNNSVYSGEFYFDAYGNILASSTNDTIGDIAVEAIKGIHEGACGEILMGDADDEIAYAAIIQRLGFDDEFLYGSSDEAETIFKYSYSGASSYSENYMVYNDMLEAYKQNMRVEPYDAKVYKLVKYNSMY